MTADALARYQSLMDVVRLAMTNRAFASFEAPRQHFEDWIKTTRHKVTYRDDSKID